MKRSEANLKTAIVGTPAIVAPATGSQGAISKNGNVKPGSGQHWSSPPWVAATGEMLGKPRHPNESEGDYRDRIYGAVAEKMREAKAQVRRHN